MPKDYYKILGVEKGASEEEIKKAYRRLAHEHHPDKNGGTDARFKDINEAYQVLGDKEKRRTYDQFGSAAFEQGGFGQGGFGGPFGQGGGFGGFDFNQAGFQGAEFGDLGDILGEMFGFGGGSRKKEARGKDIEVDAELTLKEAALGVEKIIRLFKHVACSRCHGNGAEPGSPIKDCPSCGGAGQVRQTQRSLFGNIQTVVTCPACHGRGKKAEKDCVVCRGIGVERKEQTLTIAIPAGVDEGVAVRVSGEGEAAPYGGRPGDLFVRIHVLRDNRFTREGNNIISEQTIPFSLLALGGTITIESLDGPVVLTIPEGTTANTVFTLRGRGIGYARSRGRGDHLVRVIPEVPKRLTREQRRSLDDLKGAGL